jgi:hypothetical protein
MTINYRAVGVLGAALLSMSFGSAQPQSEPSLDERVATLERELTRMLTRVDLRETASAPGATTALAARVDGLERAVTRLTTDLQRIEQQASSALREAMSAQRAAQDAYRLARDASLRR